MAVSQSVTIGARIFTLAKLTLGQLRHNEALRDAVAALPGLGAGRSGVLPTADQFETMLLIAHASAQVAEPSLTLEDLSAALDAEDYDQGFLRLADCVSIATVGAAKTRLSRVDGAPVQGEAESPSSSTSVDSTGSSPQPPAGGTETLTT